MQSGLGTRARRNTVADALARAAGRHRERQALAFAGRTWSFAALDAAAGRAASWLQSLGLGPGDRVAALARNSDAYLILWLACCRGGQIHVPLNFALTDRELHYLVAQSGARAIVADPALATRAGIALRVAGQPATVRSFDDVLVAAGSPLSPRDPALDEDAVCQLLYTSGTTADPKGAAMTHGGLLAQYMSGIVELEFTARDRALAALPLYHVAQMHCFTMPQLLAGATTVLIDAPEPATCLRLIEQHRLTSFFAPPTVWISLLRHPDFAVRDLTSLVNVYYGASIMPVPVLHELRRRLPGARPFNCYGQSEIAPLATVLRPEEHDERPASCGRPVLNVATRIVDPEMRDVPAGTQGEIVHRSPQLMAGYWNKPSETAAAFAGDWFHSGDIGVMDEAGFITVVDRLKDVIKTGGTMVASREVEEVLFTHPAVSEVAVIALPDPKWIEAVTAVVVLRAGHEADEASLVAHARQSLAPFKVPKRVLFRADLPRNASGKLLKRELRSEYAALVDRVTT